MVDGNLTKKIEMKYIVCKFKDDGSLFITTRKSRETMLSVLQGLNQEIESIVLKEFETYKDAENFKKMWEEIDNKLEEIL